MSTDDRSLNSSERWWAEHYEWLDERGYQLRPRYAPGWAGSWKTSKKEWWEAEDGVYQGPSAVVMDASRKSDGKYVTLKRVEHDKHPHERDIAEYLQQDSLASDPKNHCVKILEYLPLPNGCTTIFVMPLLREYDDPMFETVGELIDCLQQLFEGLQFMHQHQVAHRDCNPRNAMMDATTLFQDPWHPVYISHRRDSILKEARHYSRTQRPPTYYWIDFGISCRFDPDEATPRALPIRGGDGTAPELQEQTRPIDPFPTDVYYLGNLMRRDYLDVMKGLDFLKPLVHDMIQDDPDKRPTMDEAMTRFEDIRKTLSASTLRSPLQFDSDPPMGIRDSIV